MWDAMGGVEVGAGRASRAGKGMDPGSCRGGWSGFEPEDILRIAEAARPATRWACRPREKPQRRQGLPSFVNPIDRHDRYHGRIRSGGRRLLLHRTQKRWLRQTA